MKRKFLITVLALVCTLCCAFALVACNNGNGGGDSDGDGGSTGLQYEFELNDDQASYTLTRAYKDSEFPANYEIPTTYEGLPVTAIGGDAFLGVSGIKKLTVSNGITSIGEQAFADMQDLETVVLGNGITEIALGTFSGCSKLTSINIPTTVTTIGTSAFYGCGSLVEISLSNVTSIGQASFFECSSLKRIDFGNNLAEIEANAFSYCSSLKEIILPESLTSLGSEAFLRCSSATEVVIPDSLTSISSMAFYDCVNLLRITIGSGVTGIGANAFQNCGKVVEIYNKSVLSDTEIKQSIANNEYLEIYRDGDEFESKLFAQGDYIFYDNGEVVLLVCYVGDDAELILPDTYDEQPYNIYRQAFAYNDKITSIVIPEGVEELGYAPFEGCSNLVNVSLPNSITLIDYIGIGNSGSIKYNEYEDGKYLGNHDNPYAVLVSVAQGTTVLTIHEDTKSLSVVALQDANNIEQATLPVPIIETVMTSWYYNLVYWKIIDAKSLVITGTDDIPMGLLKGFGKLESLTVPFVGESLTQNSNSKNSVLGYIFGDETFEGAASVTHRYGETFTGTAQTVRYYIPSSLKSVTVTGGNILYGAFSNTWIENITLPEGITSIDERAFEGCSSITSIVIPDSVIEIGDNAFDGCHNLRNITLGSGLKTISQWAFNGTHIVSIVIPTSVTVIGEGAFEGLSYFECVYYAGTETQWNSITLTTAHNTDLTNSNKIYFYSETQPSDGGNYWHYDIDGVTPVKW